MQNEERVMNIERPGLTSADYEQLPDGKWRRKGEEELAAHQPAGRKRSTKSANKGKIITQASLFRLADGTIGEMTYDPNTGQCGFAIRNPDGYITQVAELETPTGDLFVPYNDGLVEKGVILLPSQASPYESEKALVEDIRRFIHRYVDLDGFHEQIATYYVLLSWVHDSFNVLPYLRVLGDHGTGKTRFLQVVGAICYKPVFAGGATTASPIFRIIEKYRGTLILDEADFKHSEAWVEIIKILNCGYMKGFPVLRSEKIGNHFEPRAYDVFGPKLIANKKRFEDPALESRMLTKEMTGYPRPDIPIILPDSFWEEAQELRNKLLSYRLENSSAMKADLNQVDAAIEPRLNQIVVPLKSIIKDSNLKAQISGFIREYNQQLIEERGMSNEALVLEAIIQLASEDRELSIKAITERTNEKLAEDDVDPNKAGFRFTPHHVGNLIREKLKLKTEKRGKDRRYHLVWDTERMAQLAAKFGQDFDIEKFR